MSSINKAIIIGNLGADPETRTTPSGQAVTTLRVATNERWTDKSGEKQERTTWHRVVCWNKLAEICAQYLKSGRSVYVEGRIDNRSYEDKEGNEKWISEIVAREVKFLGAPAGGGQRQPDMGPPKGGGSQHKEATWGDGDALPF